MWQAMVASWLMAMAGGQLELNPPLNFAQPESAVVQPAQKTPAEIPADHSPAGNAFSAPRLPPMQRESRAAVDNPPSQPNQPAEVDVPPALPKPILTKQTYFSLPTWAQGTPPKNSSQIVEVQLFVSHDHGVKWNFYTRVKPNQDRIPFRTAADGEYWFATRTLDRAGKIDPLRITTPTTVVEIDTKPPVALFSAEADTGGQVSARWEISDPHLKPDSLTLQYRLSKNGPWQPVAVGEKDSSISETTLSGEVSWWPTPGTPEIVIRAEVSDTLGNKAVAHAQVNFGANGKATSSLSKEERPGVKAVSARNSQNAAITGANQKAAAQKRANQNSAVANALLNNPYLAYLPPDEKPRMVNSRLFELDYDLQSVGPSGVSRVELFGTRDGSRTWRSFGVDSDNRSPVAVRADEEGLYGFQIIVTSGAGLSDPPPKSGDKPAIWIGVDLTRPVAKITAVEFGDGADANQLNIAWEAADKMPAEKPITLYYSAQPAGPYTPFAQNLENTGRYSWQLDATLPPIAYLRLEVVDEAGNHTFYDHPQPIALDRSRPTGRIRDVRPAGM